MIAKGCGTASASSVVAEEQSWSKIGHILGHMIRSYFLVMKALISMAVTVRLLCFPPDYYNEEYLRGEARFGVRKVAKYCLYTEDYLVEKF